MSKRYEALLALDTRGKEESAKEIIERLEKTIAEAGATIEQVQRLEKREFAYEHNHSKSGYYVNFIIEADPAVVEQLRAKLKLDKDVTLQQYTSLPAAKPAVSQTS